MSIPASEMSSSVGAERAVDVNEAEKDVITLVPNYRPLLMSVPTRDGLRHCCTGY